MKYFDVVSAWWKNMLRKRRICMHNATDDSEEWHTHISPAGILAASVALVLLLFIVILTFVAYSPILEFLPGYRTEANRSRESLIENIMRVDSMERMMNDMQTYNNNIALIMEGKTPVVITISGQDTTKSSKTLVMPSREDSLLRSQMEGNGPYGIGQSSTRRSVREAIEMTTPIEGIITEKFNVKEASLGVRIAAAPDAQISAVDNGTVVMSMWTPETGYIVQIQHTNNLLSVYRNMSQTLVTKGQVVKGGQIIGNNSEGQKDGQGKQFEFELWNNGKPVDPEGYIVF